MLSHKQEDGDKAGKRIASEAGRRYIMTHAGGATGGGVGKGGERGKASAGARGSGPSVAGAVVL